MKKFIIIFLMFISTVLLSPFNLDNHYLRATTFDNVKVEKGDNLWIIAERYTNEETDVKILVQAIIEVNNLDKIATITTGQTLKIPVLYK